ncbi:hypothetical protein CEUSTIGMA_g8960.t1 [Chlamydomonas eustigma]|uniref:Uncharacterized protein n=1 Tax=Chlamydomonas eustigma TaxID=1157962 RepID=A0A250XF44_9CHLO|nr:hypothetical protein CEUSTIGMA_g8960.t1 [Chlamydomonas eustigma]|eukprot:GAX81532.1 hypothetical protein CEUSTIGMA_g8960.t1 [Chlamydomonas eustigma]
MDKTAWFLVGSIIAVAVCIVIVISYVSSEGKVKKHPMLASVKYKKLSKESQTRKRLERAAELFAEGWKKLMSEVPGEHESCLQYFAKAVEIDEVACGWKTKFEERLELIGDLFSLNLTEQQDIYHSMMAEAYLVLLLYTVVDLYGKPSMDVEEDYRVVKSRMDRCVQLQPKNPVTLKLRADWTMRFPAFADTDACLRDYIEAIRLAESDPDGKDINANGVDPTIQRSFILAFCHYKSGGLLQKKKDFEAARHHYEEAIKHADGDLPFVPEAHFCLSVLAMIDVRPNEDRLAALSRASRHYRNGFEAAKKLKRWMPSPIGHEGTQRLAKGLLPKFAKACHEAVVAQDKAEVKRKEE